MDYERAMQRACDTDVSAMAKTCGLVLNKCQKTPTIGWLKSQSDASLATGRTTYLALAYMQQAVDDPGAVISLFSHVPGSDRPLVLMLESMLPCLRRPFTLVRGPGATLRVQ